MKQEIPWTRFAIEAIVIIGSILIAFIIDASWDQRQDRIAERELLAAINQDMLANLSEASNTLDRENRRFELLDTFLASSKSQLALLPPEPAQEMLAGLIGINTFIPFDGSIRTADLSLLSVPELRSSLGAWSGAVADALENTPQLMNLLNEVRFAIDGRALEVVLTPEIEESTAGYLAELKDNEAFLTRRLAMQLTRRAAVRKVEAIQDSTEEVLRLIRNQHF